MQNCHTEDLQAGVMPYWLGIMSLDWAFGQLKSLANLPNYASAAKNIHTLICRTGVTASLYLTEYQLLFHLRDVLVLLGRSTRIFCRFKAILGGADHLIGPFTATR